MPLLDLYYTIRPLIPRPLQISIRRYLARRKRKTVADRWPILEKAGTPPSCWEGWPEGKKFALVLTHDVETQEGHDKCRALMELEEELGFRSSFNLVPERYNVSAELRREMQSRGFEVGVHGLHHDGHLFRCRKIFESRKPRINRYLNEWKCAGFRSPSMRQNLAWIGELDVEYDSSTFDTDPFEPHPHGTQTIFPFVVETTDGASYVELPYTLPQDSTLFIILGETTADVWKQKLDWIVAHNGMVLVNTHPDYMRFGGSTDTQKSLYDVTRYRELLGYVLAKYKDQYWQPLPREMAHYWKQRCNQNVEAPTCCSHRSRRQADLAAGNMKAADIWIDLDNTPHVPFFKPIIRELEARGYRTFITARDAFQVCELADYYKLPYHRIGHHYGKSKALKIIGTFIRAAQLARGVHRHKPALAVSHGSRSQVVAANVLRIPSVLIYDYEFVRFPVMMRPTWAMVPDVVKQSVVQCHGDHVLNYPGLKENVYLGDFRPEPDLPKKLGIRDSNGIRITVRPPATEAHYHVRKTEELFDTAMELLSEANNIHVILLPRNKRQANVIRDRWHSQFDEGKFLIPAKPVDGLSLLWESDLVISGGGTMNREAAVLGVPVYSIFCGRLGAVDRHLAETGRLVLCHEPEELKQQLKIEHRKHRDLPSAEEEYNATIEAIVDHIVHVLTLSRQKPDVRMSS